MTEITHLHHKKQKNLTHSTNLLSRTNPNHHRATMPLSGRQEDIPMKVALSLAKHINWRTKKLKHKAYVMIAEELNTFFGVSPYYVGTIWRKHKQDILDAVNCDLVKSLKTLMGCGHCHKISVFELYAKVNSLTTNGTYMHQLF